jgi:hypothetical protein
MIRQSMLLAACALAPFALTGCADGDKPADNVAASSVASPAPVADELARDLSAFDTRIRTADAALGRVVGDSATDPEDRIAALDKSVAALGPATASSLGAKLKSAGASVVAGWDASLDAATDAELRKVVAGGRDEAKRRFEELDKALRGADAAILHHAGLLRDARSALGSRPNASQLVASRPVSDRVTAAGNKVAGWLKYAATVAKTAGAASLPVPVAPAAHESVGSSLPAPDAPAAAVAEHRAEPAPPGPVVSTPPTVVTPAPLAPASESSPVAKPAEPSEPKPVARPDPVPEPVDA